MTQPTTARRMPSAMALAQYVMLGFIVLAALAGSFTHMHDWTIREIDAALLARGIDAHTPNWFGWANAVTSELMPTSAFLSIQQRKVQNRSTTVPTWIFAGSFVVSIMAQLSATGIDILFAAEFLAMLPALAVLIMSKVIFGDIEHAGKVRAEAAARAELAAELAAELRRKERREAAELSERRRVESAELKRQELREVAELERQRTELAAELKRQELHDAAELERQHEREIRDHAAELERQRIAAEQAGLTERARIEADERREEAARQERREAAERDRQAERAEAEAQARRAAAGRVAAARHADHEQAASGAPRVRRPRHETQALVDDVLATLAEGTPREDAVQAVAAALTITARYARDFVPEGWVAGSSVVEGGVSSAGWRHLTVVGSA